MESVGLSAFYLCSAGGHCRGQEPSSPGALLLGGPARPAARLRALPPTTRNHIYLMCCSVRERIIMLPPFPVHLQENYLAFLLKTCLQIPFIKNTLSF